jgi:hypothetical protein
MGQGIRLGRVATFFLFLGFSVWSPFPSQISFYFFLDFTSFPTRALAERWYRRMHRHRRIPPHIARESSGGEFLWHILDGDVYSIDRYLLPSNYSSFFIY